MIVDAAELQVAATPMEGFGHQQFDNVLGFTEKGLHTAVAPSIGYKRNFKKQKRPHLASF
ncbi:hypothetical protein ACTJKN_15210 [Pedobacter sp. 22163]|uniref:hypothetical protein n=1 Tax=Pedobacter sp. 22163 TaxID=3453883 RepID=UPI003F879EEF